MALSHALAIPENSFAYLSSKKYRSMLIFRVFPKRRGLVKRFSRIKRQVYLQVKIYLPFIFCHVIHSAYSLIRIDKAHHTSAHSPCMSHHFQILRCDASDGIDRKIRTVTNIFKKCQSSSRQSLSCNLYQKYVPLSNRWLLLFQLPGHLPQSVRMYRYA